MSFDRFDPAAFLVGLRKNENSQLPSAKVAKAAKVLDGNDPTLATLATSAGGALENRKSSRIYPRLRWALVRELWSTRDTRAFELDITVKAARPLAEACPGGIEPGAWRQAIEAASAACSACPEGNPVLTFRRPPMLPALGPDKDDLDDEAAAGKSGKIGLRASRHEQAAAEFPAE